MQREERKSFEDHLRHMDREKTLDSFLEILPYTHRKIVKMRLTGLGYKEIAKTCGRKHQTVRNVVCTSMKILRENNAGEKEAYISKPHRT